MSEDETVLEFLDGDGRVAAIVRLPARTMFWSEGLFEHGDSFARHATFFSTLEQRSRQFQAAGADSDHARELLNRLWNELNERFEIRRRGDLEPLTDVGLHLNRPFASVRWN